MTQPRCSKAPAQRHEQQGNGWAHRLLRDALLLLASALLCFTGVGAAHAGTPHA